MGRVKKVLGRALVAIFAGVLALTVAGCGENPEEEVRKTVDATFAVLTSPDSKGIGRLYDPNGAELLRTYGIDVDDFLHTVFANLEYTVDSVTLNDEGDRATVQLTISNINFDIALQAALNNFDTWSASDEALEAYQNGQEAALFQKLFEFLYDEYASYTAVKASNTATMVLVKGENGWEMDLTDEGIDEFFSACLGGGSLSSL